MKVITKSIKMKISNQVQLVGRLGAHPQVKTLENGIKMARFPLAVSETYTNKAGEKVTDVQWHSICAWNGLADIAERILHKGIMVTVSGRLQKRNYTGSEGEKRSNTEVIANELLITQKKAA
jgi:single-strand DNA-binding protein